MLYGWQIVDVFVPPRCPAPLQLPVQVLLGIEQRLLPVGDGDPDGVLPVHIDDRPVPPGTWHSDARSMRTG